MVETGRAPRVLIIRPGALGDTLMLLPALTDLAGKVSVTVVARRPGLDIIRSCVDQAMDLEGEGWHRLFAGAPNENTLPVSNMDVATAFFSDEDGTIRRNLKRSLPGAAVHVFRSFPPREQNMHVAEYLARCLKTAGFPVDPARSMATVKGDGLCRGRRMPEGEKRIVFHPGSGSLEKNHPPGFWVDLATRFTRDAMFKDFKRMLLLGPAEKDLHPYFAANLESGDTEILLSWDTNLLLKTLDSAALYLGHDSGVTHLSAMRCIRTVALFRKENSVQWAPLGPFVRVIESQAPCQQLFEDILEAARELVSSDGRSRPE
jgi:heptosyltransferase III